MLFKRKGIKFFVYLMPLAVILAFNQYLKDFLPREKLTVNLLQMGLEHKGKGKPVLLL